MYRNNIRCTVQRKEEDVKYDVDCVHSPRELAV